MRLVASLPSTLLALAAVSASALAQPATSVGPSTGTPTAPTPSTGDPVADAAAEIDAAAQLYQQGDLKGALDKARHAYGLDPKPDYLFSLARIEGDLKLCDKAIPHFQEYLRNADPATQGAQVARDGIVACGGKLDEPKAPDAGVATHPDLPPPPRRAPFYKDVLGDGLAAGGVIAGAAGLGIYLSARKDNSDAGKATGVDEWRTLYDRARDKQKYAIIAGSIGGALAVGAIIRWTTHKSYERASVALVPTEHGWSLAAAGRF